MASSVIFPNLEQELIAALNKLLVRSGNPVTDDVAVSIKHHATRGGKQITVRADGGGIVETVLKVEGWGISVWADSLDEAADLAQMVEALLPMVPIVSKHVREVSITLSPIRPNPEGTTNRYYLTGDATVRGETFALSP